MEVENIQLVPQMKYKLDLSYDAILFHIYPRISRKTIDSSVPFCVNTQVQTILSYKCKILTLNEAIHTRRRYTKEKAYRPFDRKVAIGTKIQIPKY